MIFSRLVEDYGNERQIKGFYLYAIFEICFFLSFQLEEGFAVFFLWRKIKHVKHKDGEGIMSRDYDTDVLWKEVVKYFGLYCINMWLGCK